jgi:acyl-coenzyme A synthetase/AMP-(fatty) acid ligase
MGLTPEDVVFQPHEMAWSYSMGPGFLYSLGQGAAIVASGGKVSPQDVFKWLARFPVSVFASVPSLYRKLLSSRSATTSINLPSLRYCMSAGEPLSQQTCDEWKRTVGVELFNHLGQGELSMFIANPPHLPPRRGSLGLPIPGYDVAVLDERGNRCTGQVGLLAVGADNPALFYEYLGMPDKWEESHQNGWYLTGDFAEMDSDGYFWHASRADDMINSRGYLVSPHEVEEVLLSHPQVAEVGVVGLPHEEHGEAVTAFVVLNRGESPSSVWADELRDYVNSRIAPYKTPRNVYFLKSLPKTHTGKISRQLLRQRAYE